MKDRKGVPLCETPCRNDTSGFSGKGRDSFSPELVQYLLVVEMRHKVVY